MSMSMLAHSKQLPARGRSPVIQSNPHQAASSSGSIAYTTVLNDKRNEACNEAFAIAFATPNASTIFNFPDISF